MTIEERAGAVLAKNDLSEERHNLKMTDEEAYEAFQHNKDHPFMVIVKADAEAHARIGKPYVLHRRITTMREIDKEANLLYYNGNDTWNDAGNALVWKYLRETIPGLITPRMKFGCKGEKLLLDNNPGKYSFVRDEYAKRANKKQKEIKEGLKK